MKKQILGGIEVVKIKNNSVVAKIDTGANKSSINLKLAKKLGLTKDLWDIKKVKSANGEEYRPIIKSKIKLKNQIINTKMTVSKRENLNYQMLIGRDVLKERFLVDVSR